jgi:dTDP-glucose 4,6-dehydratase
MASCLITGIGGSIGCHVFAHIMHRTKWDVVGIDSFRHQGLSERIVEVKRTHPDWNARLRVFTHDLTAPVSWKLAQDIGAVDCILNLASLSDVHASIEQPREFIEKNVAVACTMLDYARVAQPRVFLQVSTDEVYGPTDGKVFHKEWDPIVPSNPYSASKAAQEAIAISYWRTYGVPLVIVNLMNNFGEMQSATKFPALVQRKLAHGETVMVHGSPSECGSRHYIHSRNSADAFLHLISGRDPRRHVPGDLDKPDRYNIVPQEGAIRNDELVDMIEMDMFGAHGGTVQWQPFTEARPGHDRHYGLDGAKLRATGWKQPLSLEDSLHNTVKWQQEHSEWLETKSGS